MPGGVGPMTVAMLMQNTIDAAKKDFDRRVKSDWDLRLLNVV